MTRIIFWYQKKIFKKLRRYWKLPDTLFDRIRNFEIPGENRNEDSVAERLVEVRPAGPRMAVEPDRGGDLVWNSGQSR